jgi:hypothetical protein
MEKERNIIGVYIIKLEHYTHQLNVRKHHRARKRKEKDIQKEDHQRNLNTKTPKRSSMKQK